MVGSARPVIGTSVEGIAVTRLDEAQRPATDDVEGVGDHRMEASECLANMYCIGT